MRVYTIGYSNRTWEEFLALLQKHGINVLIDIRSRTRSRWPQFNGPRLRSALNSAGIMYYWQGAGLGGKDRDWPAYMLTGKFSHAMVKLGYCLEKNRTAIMCAEKDHQKCHRRFIAEHLQRQGFEVTHIGEEEKEVRDVGSI